MPIAPDGSRPLLQRRDSFTATLQAFLDGLALLLISYLLIDYHIGVLTMPYLVLLLLLLMFLAVAFDHFGIYRSYASFTRKAVAIFQAWATAFGLLLALAFVTKQGDQYSRALVGQLFAFGMLAQVLLHFGLRRLQLGMLKHSHQAQNVLIIGTGRLANFLSLKITTNPWLGQNLVGCVAMDDGEPEAEAESSNQPRIVGRLGDLMDLIERHHIAEVYIVTPIHAAAVLESIYFNLLDKHVAVHWVPDIFSLRLVNHSVREIAGIPVLTLSETPLTGTRRVLKTLEDFLLAFVILILISPLLVAVAVAVRLDSPGPVIFRQRRMGWNGKVFEIWKFRSMHVHEPEGGIVVQAQKDDPRVTRVGRFIRRTSLDELPQIFNVLRGEMSLVGPRPHAIQHDMEYSRRIHDYFARHNLKPGITGLAQVRGYRGETRNIEQMILRVESDIEYINNWSLWLDVSILLRTVTAFTGRHAY